MSTNSKMIQIGSVEALLIHKGIKNLHLAVLPPIGSIRVTAPLGMTDEAVRSLLTTRLVWIRKQQEKFKGQERQTPREYVSGESHYLFGERFRLELQEKEVSSNVEIKRKSNIILTVRKGTSVLKRDDVMQKWYRERLREFIMEKIQKWEEKIGVKVDEVSIRHMKTRWGTCNKKVRRILLNTELAKKPRSSVEYVLVHEMLHLIEKKHNDQFVKLLDMHLPKWRSEKEELNRFILSHEDWG